MHPRDSTDLFTQQVASAQYRVYSLLQSTQSEKEQQLQLLEECFVELQNAVEELRVAETELRQQNEELIEARQITEFQRKQYQELFEFAPDGYLVTDLFGKIQEVNRAAAAILHVEQQYLIGKAMVSFIPQADRRQFRSVMNQLPAIHRKQEWELSVCRRDNELRDVALTVETVQNELGQAIGLRWLMRDITSRKQAEAQLHQTRLQNLHLLETDRLKTQFMATISHELRTPLQAILGFAELTLRRLQQRGDSQMVSLLEPIVRNGKHLFSLIESLLDFSRLQAKHLELRLEDFDVIALATHTVSELQTLADRKGLEIRVEVPSKPLMLRNDPTRLRQVLVNLLSNAIKFTETGSVVLTIAALQPALVLITVQDTGIGISPIDQPQVFKEFWQVNQSTTRPQGGTGLGLSIASNLVELMQGSITIESQVGEGSCFRVELPQVVNLSLPTTLA